MLTWIAAVLLGALVPALIVAGLSLSAMVLPMAFATTLGHSIILGLPVALLYRAKRWTRLSTVIAGAFLIGAIPVGLFAWPISPSSRTTASVDGVATVIDGIPTLAGWLSYFKLLGMFGGLGAVGGLVFWLTLRWSGALMINDSNSSKPVLRQQRIGFWLASVAITASAAIFALPSLTADRSCHNMFRDGRRSVSSKVNIDLDITMGEWSRLARVLEEFGTSRGMSFRNSSESRPGVVEILGLTACIEEGVAISVHEQLWNSQTQTVLRGDRGVAISFYDLRDGASWQPLAKELVAALDSEWLGKVRFRNGGGRFVAGPPALMPQRSPAGSR